MCNGLYGETCPLMDKALYLNGQRSHPKLSKDLVGRGHSKPRDANAVCKPTVNNSNIKVLLTPYKQSPKRWPHYVAGFVDLVLWTSKHKIIPN